jgi:hypothetical protein
LRVLQHRQPSTIKEWRGQPAPQSACPASASFLRSSLALCAAIIRSDAGVGRTRRGDARPGTFVKPQD